MSNDVTKTITERATRYGSFKKNAQITQDIKKVMRNTRNWEALSSDKKEALEMIACKISRILNGDPNHYDSWHDINGYCKLVTDDLYINQGA